MTVELWESATGYNSVGVHSVFRKYMAFRATQQTTESL